VALWRAAPVPTMNRVTLPEARVKSRISCGVGDEIEKQQINNEGKEHQEKSIRITNNEG